MACRVADKDWGADFRKLSAGAALVALTLWLDHMQANAFLLGSPDVFRYDVCWVDVNFLAGTQALILLIFFVLRSSVTSNQAILKISNS